jgi:hypothetical protein
LTAASAGHAAANDDGHSDVNGEAVVVLKGIRHKIVRLDSSSMYTKITNGGGGDGHSGGIMVARTAKHYLMQAYDSPDSVAGCAEALEAFADYLRAKSR